MLSIRIFSFKHSDTKLILQTFALEVINYFFISSYINNQKKGGMPARIVGAQKEKNWKRFWIIYGARVMFYKRSWNVHGMFKLSLTDVFWEKIWCLSNNNNKKTLPEQQFSDRRGLAQQHIFLHLIKCVIHRNQTHWSVLTFHQKTKAQHLISSFSLRHKMHVWLSVCLSSLQASNSTVIILS